MAESKIELPLRTKSVDGQGGTGTNQPVAFGKAAKELFLIDPSFRNLNHGLSLVPRPDSAYAHRRQHQDLSERSHVSYETRRESIKTSWRHTRIHSSGMNTPSS